MKSQSNSIKLELGTSAATAHRTGFCRGYCWVLDNCRAGFDFAESAPPGESVVLTQEVFFATFELVFDVVDVVSADGSLSLKVVKPEEEQDLKEQAYVDGFGQGALSGVNAVADFCGTKKAVDA